MDGQPTQEKGPTRTPIEEASREDLVKHVRRQLALLQKQKAKCDELNVKCRSKDEEIEALKGKCNFFETMQREHEELQEAYHSLQGSQEKQFHSFQALEEALAAANDDAVKWRRKYQDCVEKLECTESKLTALVQGTECLRDEVKRLEHENKDLQQRAEELKNAEAEARSLITSLQQQNKQSAEDSVSSARLEEKVQELLAHCEALKQERDSANASRDAVNSELENVAKEKKEYTEQFFKLLEERSLLENQRDMKVNECNLLQEEKHGLEKQVSDLYASKEDLEKKEKEFAKILDENSNLEKSLTEAMAENTQLQQTINDLQEKIAEMNSEQDKLRNDVAEGSSKAEVEKLNDELSNVEERLSLKTEELQKLEADLKVALELKEEAERLVDNMRAELESSRQAGRDEESQNDAFQKLQVFSSEIEELKRQLNAVTAEKDDALLSLCNYQKAEVEWKAKKDELENEALGAKKERDVLIENLEQSASHMSALEKQLQDTLQEKHNLVEELAGIRDLQQFLEDEAKELRRECDKVKTEVKRLEADLENDHLHIQKLEHELEEAEERERTSGKDLDALRCLLEDIVACISELQEELFTCKVNGTELNFETLGEKFKRIFCLVVTAVENGLADFNVEELVQPCETSLQCCVNGLEGIASHSEEVEMLKREAEELHDQLLSSRTSIEQLQLEKRAIEDELAEEKHQKDEANAKVAAQAEAIASLEKKLASGTPESEGRVSCMERQLEELSTSLSAKEDLMRKTLDDLERSNAQSSTLEADNHRLIHEIAKLKEELASKTAVQSDESGKVYKLHEGLVKLNADKNVLLETQNTVKEELRRELDGFCALLTANQQHIESVLKNAAELEKQCCDLKSGNCRLLDENACLKLELAKKEKDYTQADDDITHLRAQVAGLTSSKQEVDERLQDLSTQLSSQENIVHSTSEKLTQLEAMNDILKAENAELQERLSQLKSEISAKEECCLKADEVSAGLHVELDSVLREKSELQEAHKALVRRFDEAQQEIVELEDDCNKKLAVEQSLRAEVFELTSKVSALMAENRTKTSLVEEIHGRLDDLLDRSDTLQEELSKKRTEVDESKKSLFLEQQKILGLQEELTQVKAQVTDILAEQERFWAVFFPEQVCDMQTASLELSKVVSSISVWDELNQSLLRYIISVADIAASGSNSENLSGDIQAKVREYSGKVEGFCEDKADVITLKRVEDVKLGIRVLELIHPLIASRRQLDQSVTTKSDIESGEKVAELVATVKEKDEKLSKFKALVVKLKRELAEKNKQVTNYEKEQNGSKAELDRQLQASKQALQNFQSLQKEYDKLQDDYEATKSLCKELETKLTSVVNELATSKLETSAVQAERDKLRQAQEVASAEIKAWEQCKMDLEAKLLLAESEMSTTMELNEQLRGQFAVLEGKIAELTQQLQAKKDQHDSTIQQLEKVQKETKMQSLLHLEMADYERSVAELNGILKEKSRELESMREESLAHQAKIASLTEHIEHLEEQRKCDESKISTLKETVASLKEGLGASRKHEEQLVKAEVRLESDLKAAQLREEEAKLNYAELLRKFQNMESSLRTTRENAQRNIKALESKSLLLKEELATTRNELNNTRTEFENYKTRVHTVLKQQKKSTEGSSNNNDNEANGKLQQLVEQLRGRVQELVEQLETQRSEAELVQEEYEHLSARHQQVVSELEAREKDWKSRLEEAIKNNTQEMSLELDKQLKQQHDKLTSTFQKKLAEQEEQYRASLESQKELIQEMRLELRQEQQMKVFPQEDTFDISLQERQEGEGSECATPNASIPNTTFPWEVVPSAGFAPLEQLLHGGSENEENIEALSARINEAQKKLNHMSELLNESESSNLRMTEQIRVLKEEIRRLERNKEREKHAENLEYLKNIILKFTTLKGGNEKERLIPVLTTMLKLSPEEQKQLQSVVAGSGEADSAAAGWGGYLPRWPGIV